MISSTTIERNDVMAAYHALCLATRREKRAGPKTVNDTAGSEFPDVAAYGCRLPAAVVLRGAATSCLYNGVGWVYFRGEPAVTGNTDMHGITGQSSGPSGIRPAAFLSAVLAMGLTASSALGAEGDLPAAAERQVDFSRDIQPLLASRCIVCHGAAQQMNGLRFDRKADALRGGYAGPVILPGDSAKSKLIQLVAGVGQKVIMPPAGPKLSSEEIGLLRAWIDQGAEWPETAADAEPERAADSELEHWAFRPVRKPDLPRVEQSSWIRNNIDSFVLARLEAEGIKPSADAPKATLARRVSLDLTGLPADPEAVELFVADRGPGAYERLVDELLESEHYGEKWARPWLDLARYADSDGYEKDRTRPHAWRYRHWVINALNRDIPFDEFTIDQVAGDLAPGAGIEQRVAAGFHRNTLKNREGGVNIEQYRFEETIDRANTVATVWLGLSLGCAQCHDHKYDPTTQADYYRFYAFFNSIDEIDIDAPLAGEVGPYLAARPGYDRKRREILAEHKVHELQPPWEAKMIEASKNPGKWTDWDLSYDVLPLYMDKGHDVLGTPPEKRDPRQAYTLKRFFLKNYGRVVSQEHYEELGFNEAGKKLQALDDQFPALSRAQSVADLPEPRETHIHIRGGWDRLGLAVQPDAPGFLPPLGSDGTGLPTRLDLARWLVSRENPLTARVTVNRIWQEYFGRGLVLTSEDFGTQGDKPSHPKLLDWLAVDFIDQGWSLKKLHKRIVMSATYRQSSNDRPDLAEKDPGNVLLARQSRLRLPAELIRDGALAASGLLDPTVGGPSVRPPQPEGVAALGYSGQVKWRTSSGGDAYRRGLYIHFQRAVPYPFLMTFDSPDMQVTQCRRERSNTPLQALNLLNDGVFFESAQALAARVLQQAPTQNFTGRLDYAYRLTLARSPTDNEQERLLGFYHEQTERLAHAPEIRDAIFPAAIEGRTSVETAAWTTVARIVLNLDEFITRE